MAGDCCSAGECVRLSCASAAISGKALQLAPESQGAESEAALAFAMADNRVRAESLAQDLGRRFPLDTQVQSLWLPAIQAQLALNRKKPSFSPERPASCHPH